MERRLKILSSDDDEGIRALLFSLLTEHGHEVDFARDGDEVFKNLGRARYDLLILDINTPGLNGYKVAEKVTDNIINRPKILLFTARDIEKEKLQFVACGADAIIRKGAPCEELIKVIDELFDAGNGRAADAPGMEDKMTEETAHQTSQEIGGKLQNDLQYCLAKMTQVEDLVNTKNMRYEEFIRDLLKEKQRTEKNYLEFKRIEEQVVNMKNWGYAVAAVAGLAVLRSFF